MKMVHDLKDYGRLPAVAVAMLIVSSTFGQSAQRAAFVANNGNLEGSVTAYSIDNAGALAFVNRIITGTRTSTTLPCSGCNATSISLTPNGRFVAASHAAGDAPLPDGITIFSVASDASIMQVLHLQLFSLPSPLGVRWINDTYLAVTRTDLGANNGVAVYAFNPLAPSLALVDTKLISGFSTTLAVHPNRQFLIAQSTGPSAVHMYQVNANGTLTFLNSYPTGNYPLGQGISPDGLRLYAGSGASGNVVNGWFVDPNTGAMTLMTGSPFAVPSSSPKQVVVSGNNQFAFAGYGGSGYFRNFAIDQVSGALTFLGFAMTVGTTGSLGELDVLDTLLLVPDRDTISDGVRGLYSFTINGDGSLTQNGPIVSSQGITPNAVVGWKPLPLPCPGDTDGNQVVDIDDLVTVITHWGATGRDAADINGDQIVNIDDLVQAIVHWGACP